MQWSLQVFGFMLFIIVQNVSGQMAFPDENSCNTNSETCVVLSDCTEFTRLLQQRPLAESTARYLQKSNCGFVGKNPKVCCKKSREISKPSQSSSRSGSDRGVNKIDRQQPSSTSLEPPNVTKHPNLRLLDDKICGPINSDRILGGNRTGLYEFPWMALLAYHTGGPNPEFRCGGSVINKRYVLSAAHCVVELPKNLKLSGVRIGDHDLSSERDCEMAGTFEESCAEKYQDLGIEKVHAHPDYSSNKLHNDISLLRLNDNIDFRPQNAKPICLPIGSAARIMSKKLVVTGWGITEDRVPSPVMMKVALPRYSQEKCAAVYQSQKEIWRKQICMGGLPSKNSCSGDSGGPLQAPNVYNGNARYVQYGIVSFGVRNCETDAFPGVYTRVDFYLDWILDTMKA